MDFYQIIKRPLITEKATALKEQGKYLFVVDQRANKYEIGKAVEEFFKVKVEKVNTAIFCGKKRQMGKTAGYRSDWKKAIVTLKKGQKIQFEEKV